MKPKSILNKLLKIFLKPYGLTVVPTKDVADFYLHRYSSYEEYSRVQIHLNKAKLNKVWADEDTLTRVKDILISEFESRKRLLGSAMVHVMVLSKIF